MRIGFIVNEKYKYKMSKIINGFLKSEKSLDEFVICSLDEIDVSKLETESFLVTKHRILQKKCSLPNIIVNFVKFKKFSSKKKMREINGNENIEVYNYANQLNKDELMELLTFNNLEVFADFNNKNSREVHIFNSMVNGDLKSYFQDEAEEKNKERILDINKEILKVIYNFHPLLIFSITKYSIEYDGTIYLKDIKGITKELLNKNTLKIILKEIISIKK